MRALILSAYLGLLGVAVSNDTWPRFRGSNGAGEVAGVALPEKWTKTSAKWAAELVGEGDSSPVIAKGRVFVTSAVERGASRTLQCFDLQSGEALWRRDFESAPHKRHKNNSFASSTPVLDDKRVYVIWGQPASILVVAHDFDGKEVWRKDLGRFKSGHGYAVSPTLADGVLIVPDDQPAGDAVVALDAKTGKELWKTERASQRASYSTPCIFPHESGVEGAKADVIVTDWQHGVSAYDLKTGKPRWSEVVFDINDKQRAIGSPVLWDDLVIATCGFVTGKKRLVALRPVVGGDGKPETVFQLDKGVPHVPTPLAHDGRLYLWGDSGMVTCVELPTGKVLYDRERVPARGKFFSSPVVIAGHIVNFSTTGEVVVLKAGDAFEVTAEAKLPEPTNATPASADGRLVLRTKGLLMAW